MLVTPMIKKKQILTDVRDSKMFYHHIRPSKQKPYLHTVHDICDSTILRIHTDKTNKSLLDLTRKALHCICCFKVQTTNSVVLLSCELRIKFVSVSVLKVKSVNALFFTICPMFLFTALHL